VSRCGVSTVSAAGRFVSGVAALLDQLYANSCMRTVVCEQLFSCIIMCVLVFRFLSVGVVAIVDSAWCKLQLWMMRDAVRANSQLATAWCGL
jgi:hypothetical protein